MRTAEASTIAAIATPPGQGGIGVVRLSGPAALPIAEALFRPARAGARLRSHRMVHGLLVDPRDGAVLDQALVCLMAAPRSYTGEDVVELHCHGSPVALERVLGCVLARGAELAGRGEFTQRAFLNGRLDLAQAEAVMDLISAKTSVAARVAAQAVAGGLQRRLAPLLAELTGTLAYLEATIDFVEEDLPERAAPLLIARLDALLAELATLLQRAGHGALLRDGVRVVLAGKPNVGKSSLLNALLRRDRAIVTPIAGTTRDTLEELAEIGGLPMYLIDTAGLIETADPVERLGIARSGEALRAAAIAALVLDASAPPDHRDREALLAVRAATEAPLLLVLNKCDLAAPAGAQIDALFHGGPAPAASVSCSAVTGERLDRLEDALAALALGGTALDAEDTLVENARQRHCLEEAGAALHIAREGLVAGRPAELVALDLRRALEALGGATGQQVTEAVLDRIFRDFCIGK